MKQKMIGLDRTLHMEWLNYAAKLKSDGLNSKEITANLNSYLESIVKGKEARRKTITVIKHLWIETPRDIQPLRNRALNIFMTLKTNEELLLLQWGMCIACYPIFIDLTSTIGRLFKLQDTVKTNQIIQRMIELWGDRSTLIRATQRMIRGLVKWKAITDADEKGSIKPSPKYVIKNKNLLLWFCEAYLTGTDKNALSLNELLSGNVVFPFQLELLVDDIRKAGNLELMRQGLNDNIILIKN